MNQQLNKLHPKLLTLLFLLPVCQVVFGANNDVDEPNTLTECYPRQATTFSLPPIPEGYPICKGAIEPTAGATFDADTGKIILPAVRVNQKDGYVYSLELSLLSAAADPILTFEMTHYCLNQEPTSLPNSADIPTLTLPPGQIHIPAIDIEGISYSASLNIEQPSTQLWEESEIFTRKKERIIFRVPRREVRQETIKPKYPILLVHGLNSSGQTWESYYKQDSGWWTSKEGVTYGGNIYIRDKYHLFEPGSDAENLFPSRLRSDYLSFFEIKLDNDKEENELQGDFYTMTFSNNKDISLAAQGLQLKAIVNKISDWNNTDGVYVVAHKIGGLAARAYLQFYNDEKVKGLVTIATPHYNEKGWIKEDLKILNEQQSYPLPKIDYFFVTVEKNQSIKDKNGQEIGTVFSPSKKDKKNLTSNSVIEEKIWDELISW